jgi:hypothetical protein
MINAHSFHIPVMGLGFTIDTPLKVAQYGIDAVISIGDDILIEKLRRMYCHKFDLPYTEIADTEDDFRAKRITAYLNLIHHLTKSKFEELKNSVGQKDGEFIKYYKMLPQNSLIKQKIKTIEDLNTEDAQQWVKDNLSMGSIDVNIMTKVDKENYLDDQKLPQEYNNAHASLRGYANSDLQSSVIFSAGMNPSLYAYLEQLEDFYPDAHMELQKKIVIKVSDYRSAFIQGKFLAKKGLWVSEYRVESGLNCGGHAFATDGYLLGPILAEFRDKRNELIESVHEIFVQALARKNRPIPTTALPLKITAQGGVGTAEEHQFLLDHYQVDSVGWGTPFLLVPEVVNIDDATLQKLVDAQEDDLYLSNISPLGVPFNNLKDNSKDLEKLSLSQKGRPGSSCPKKLLALNKEFTEKSLCTASRQYQHLKLKELDRQGLSAQKYETEYAKVVDKSCICVGLGTSALLVNGLDTKVEGNGVSICPGPNMAYFSKIMTLKQIIDHIYGRANMITRTDRPNMFVKELTIYVDYLKNKITEAGDSMNHAQQKYLSTFAKNLNEGIDYYYDLFTSLKGVFEDTKAVILRDLDMSQKKLQELSLEIIPVPVG